jgi:hypothetical protein
MLGSAPAPAWPARLFLEFFFLVLAGAVFVADPGWHGGDGYLGSRRHLVRDAVRLMLHRIIDGTDFEFRLNGTGEARPALPQKPEAA